jgi:hypothetical protein
VSTAPWKPARKVAFGVAVVVQLLVLYWPRAVSAGGAPGADKVVHLVVFAAVAWTGRAAGLPRITLLCALVAHALVSEVLQAALLPARSGDPLDVVFDAVGIAVGMLLRVSPGQNERRAPRQRIG